MSPLDRFLTRHHRIGLDTNIFIYFVENHPVYGGLSAHIFDAVERGTVRAVTSTLTLLEVLVQPYRKEQDHLALEFYALLTAYPHLQWRGLDLEIADAGARMRAKYSLATPDAIQVATAQMSGVHGFIGNDKRLKKVEEMECLIIDECVRGGQ